MANRDIVVRLSRVLDDYEAGLVRPADVERLIRFNVEALEALPYARVREADALCGRLASAHICAFDEEFISEREVAEVLADFRRFLASLPSGDAG